MPSPFTQYQGEQVPQINILPYTQGIANSLQKGMEDLGKGIGDYIGQYKQEQKIKETVTPLLVDEVNKYIRKDDKGKESLDDTAPTFVKNFYQQSLKEGGEDGWIVGTGRVSASTTGTAWSTLNEWQRNQELNFKLSQLQRQNDIQEFQDAVEREKVAQKEVSTYPVEVQKTQLYNPTTGKTSSVGTREEVLKETGIKPEDLWTDAKVQEYKTQGTIDSASLIGMAITGDANWNSNTKFQDLSGERDKEGNTTPYKLINDVYNKLIESGYPQEKLDSVFKKPRKTGGTGVTAEVQVNEETYNTAIQLLNSKQVQNVYKSKGIDIQPSERPLPPNVWLSKDMGTSQVIEEKTRHLNNREVLSAKYDAVVSRWNPKKPIPSRETIINLSGIHSLPTYYTQDGQQVYKIGEGYISSETANRQIRSGQGFGVGGDSQSSSAQTKQGREGFFQQFSKGVVKGGYKFTYKDPKTYIGNWEEDYKNIYSQLPVFESLMNTLDKMDERNKDSRFKKFIDLTWDERWELLNRTIQTGRTLFIAKGPETEMDNKRLEFITAGSTFLRKLSPELMQEVLNATRAIVESSIPKAMELRGFEVERVTSRNTMNTDKAREFLDELMKKHSK